MLLRLVLRHLGAFANHKKKNDLCVTVVVTNCIGTTHCAQGVWARGKSALLRKSSKVFCALLMTVKRSVDELFMHFFQNIRRLLCPQTPSGLCPWNPLGTKATGSSFAHPWINSCGHPCYIAL